MHELMRTCTAQLHIRYLYTLLLLLLGGVVHAYTLLLLMLGGVVHA